MTFNCILDIYSRLTVDNRITVDLKDIDVLLVTPPPPPPKPTLKVTGQAGYADVILCTYYSDSGAPGSDGGGSRYTVRLVSRVRFL